MSSTQPVDDTKTPYELVGTQARQSWSLLMRSMGSQKRIYVAAITVSALFGALMVALSWCVGWVTDEKLIPILLRDSPASTIWLGAFVLFAIVLALAISIALRRIAASYGVFNLQAAHRTRLAEKFTSLPPAWFKQNSTGKLLSHMSSDAEAATAVFNPLPFMVGTTTMVLISAVMLFRVDVWLALAALLIIPAMVCANLVFQKRMTPVVKNAQRLRGEVSEAIHESFDGAVLVKALGTRDLELHRIAVTTDRLRAANVRVGTVRATFEPVIEALPNFGALLVIIVGTLRFEQGAINAGDIVSAAYLLTLLAIPVRAFGWVLAELPRSVVGWNRVAGVVDASSYLSPREGQAFRADKDVDVTFSTVGYGVIEQDEHVQLLHDVSFSAPAGRVTVVMGRTGSGKTTAVSMLTRLWDATTGTIALGGVDVTSLSRQALSETIAFVPQGSFVFEDSIRMNVVLNEHSSCTDEDVWEALRLAQLEDFVRGLPQGLDTRLKEQGSDLSGGQRQRLAIARALVRRPHILVLDDATSAVDPHTEQAILSGISQRGATTVIMVAYRAATAQIADHVVFMEQGRTVGAGTHSELLDSLEQYRELIFAYESQNHDTEGES
ncbi:ABC transporter ATP-binding protein [Timonella sp. A28]|uniref:ABC transporter ATP-binding protein n=1 Tax=Timonella sp. A28 TaxID=3442640 RepID=UPI003EBB0C8D